MEGAVVAPVASQATPCCCTHEECVGFRRNRWCQRVYLIVLRGKGPCPEPTVFNEQIECIVGCPPLDSFATVRVGPESSLRANAVVLLEPNASGLTTESMLNGLAELAVASSKVSRRPGRPKVTWERAVVCPMTSCCAYQGVILYRSLDVFLVDPEEDRQGKAFKRMVRQEMMDTMDSDQLQRVNDVVRKWGGSATLHLSCVTSELGIVPQCRLA